MFRYFKIFTFVLSGLRGGTVVNVLAFELGDREIESFFKKGPIPASFCSFSFFSHFNFNTN